MEKKLIELYYHIITYYRIIQLSMALSKSNVMPPLAQHLYYSANEIPVSISKLFSTNQLSEM